MTAQRGLWMAPDGSDNGTTPKGARLAFGGYLAHDGVTPLGVRTGVVWDGGGPAVSGTASMSYNVRDLVATTMASSSNGPTVIPNDATVNIATTPAPGSGSRIDIIWIRQRLLAGDGGAETTNEAEIGVTQGDASGSPTEPTIPADAMALYRVPVPAGTLATNTCVFTRLHHWTAAAGGILRVESEAERAAITLDGIVIYYVPDKVHQALVDGDWTNVGGSNFTDKLQAGRRVSVPAGTGSINLSVEFDTPFAAEPSVTLTVNHPDLQGARVITQSETGFTARFDRESSASYWFNWQAILP